MTQDAPPEAPDNWDAQLRKGWLELAILASLWDRRLYGLEILRRLEADSDLSVAEGTVYPILSRLKRERLVESEWVESSSGHPRKYYWLTNAGRARTESMARHASSFLENLRSLLEPVLRKEGK
jgi:PadR family transcriptional regulator PadR